MTKTCKEFHFAVSGDRTLHGDLYCPDGEGPYPLVIGIHGGGWNQGSRKAYQHWGPILAENGYALFAVDRWHFAPSETPYPKVVEDLRQAIRFARTNAASMKADPERIALIGASSGAYIAAMVGLQPGSGEDAGTRMDVKAVVGVYGVYDLAAEWLFEQVTRPLDKSAEWLLGTPLLDDRALYFEASPLSHCIRSNNRLPFLVAWGTEDDVVSEKLHSEPFARALALAGFDVTTSILPYAQHYWLFEPHDEVSSRSAAFAPRLLRFLKNNV
jgi:acetyl esterase/lipase